jgi:hypothetical protein
MSPKSVSQPQRLSGRPSSTGQGVPRYWSGAVTQQSNALDLEPGVFTWRSPARIAKSLKRSAETSERRKGSPFQSAISMLNFYINRAGRNLPDRQRRVLEQSKTELRRLFGRE